MRSKILYHLFIFLVLLSSCSEGNPGDKSSSRGKDTIVREFNSRQFIATPTLEDTCNCNNSAVTALIQKKSFNRIEEYDSKSFAKKKFYDLDSQINRTLWFRDIENPTKTKFTELWNAYRDKNYYADPIDFLNFYNKKQNIPLAFMFGPNGDLWAYHIFVVRKMECCYLITRSYYRHNRFTYKAFAILDSRKLTELYDIVRKINLVPLDAKKSYGYTGFFMDNLNAKEFLIDFENEKVKIQDSTNVYNSKPKQEVLNLYEFVDKGVHWVKTYGE